MNAAPGTGKTYTLIERIKHLCKEEITNPSQELGILCFSRAAVGEVRKRVQDAVKKGVVSDDLRFIDIRTFDSFATYLINQLDEDRELINVSYDKRIEIAIELLKENPDCLNNLKHFIIDEVQDLVGVRARFVQAILSHIKCGITLLGDTCQSIYDYQVKDTNDVTSLEFQSWVKNKYKQLKEVELIENHRMSRQILELSNTVRSIIQSNSNFNVNKNTMENVLYSIPNSRRVLDISSGSILEDKKTCILCRTNGEALWLSNQLKNNQVENYVVRAADNRSISAWVGQVLSNLDYNIFDFEMFKEIAEQRNIKEIESKWELLLGLQERRTSKINIQEIQECFLNDYGSLADFYSFRKSNLEISTVHRAKGKEYDEILLFEDAFKWSIERTGEDEMNQELKTFYVALTRAKSNLGKVTTKRRNYQIKLKGNNERWVNLGKKRTSKPYISFLEVGLLNDVEKVSFIDKELLGSEVVKKQKYINEKINIGDEVILKCINDINGFMSKRYDIIHKGNLIGSMSENFTKAICYSIKEVSVFFTNFPVEINQIYVDDIVTYFEKKIEVETENSYKKNKFWNGITLNGLGKLCWKNGDE